jgi:hypothetical protein
MRFPGFLGPSGINRSLNVDAERTINFYPELVDGGATGKPSRYHLHGTPGLRPFVGLPAGPVRGLFSQDGRMWAVGATRLYEVFANQTGVELGVVAVDANPATLSSNGTAGHQLFVTSGGFGYVYDLISGAFARITDPEFPYPCSMGLYLDTYFVALKAKSRQFYISDNLDGTTWSGLAVAETSSSTDDLLAMAGSHRELWLAGSHVTHVWYNSGAASFPFQPVSGAHIEHGILAPFSMVKLDNTLFWLGQDETGIGIVWRANGYTPERISSHAMEYALGQVGRLDDAIGWAYQEEGHTFYLLYVPSAETTWCYDIATGLWHERALWDPDALVWTPHPGRCHCFAFGKHLVGDRATGTIYEMSLSLLADDLVEA